MKAWRNPENQAQFRKDFKLHDVRRVGKLLRNTGIRILPVPSFLVQGLMIRAGLAPAA